MTSPRHETPDDETPDDETAIRGEIAVINALWQGLDDFLSACSPADLRRPSACAAWSVRDVAGHLTNRAERQIASMTRGRRGDASPPPGFTPPASNQAMSAANADADIAYAQSLGDNLIPEFRRLYSELAALLDTFAGPEWRAPCWHPRRGAMTAREYVSQRIQELAVHDWDIRSAFDPAAALHPAAVPTLLGMSAGWLRAAYHPAPNPPRYTARYRFNLSSAAPDTAPADAIAAPANAAGIVSADTATVDVAAGPETAAAAISHTPDAGLHPPGAAIHLTVSCPANDYLLLAYGRLSAERALATGRMSISGDPTLLRRFEEWMQGF